MRRSIKMLVGFVCALALFSGCQTGSGAESLPTFAQEAPAEDSAVHTVQEFIDAIKPNATVTLPSGSLVLSDGSDQPVNNPYCKWEWGTLVISNVDGLTIRGSGKDLSVLKTEPRNAAVLTFTNCRDLTLSGLTAGHTQRVEACEGNVVNLNGCSNVTLKDVGLFGCGAVGLNGWLVRDLTLEDTDIYDCSVSGVSVYQGGGVLLKNCRLFDIGAEQDALYALDVSDCMDVRLENCRIDNNRLRQLISCYASNVQLLGCSMEGNTLTDAMFHVSGQYGESGTGAEGSVGLTDPVLVGNTAWKWLDTDNGGQVMIGDEEMTEDGMAQKFGAFARKAGEATTGDAGSQRDQITVKNADEFLAALGPDREIVIDCPVLDLSTAKNYGMDGGDCYRWEDPFDGPQLTIFDVENLTIRGKDGKDANVVSAVPRYAQVLAFDGCTNLTIRDLTAGHTKEPGYCIGGVLQFRNCGSVTVENTGLFGCGTIGVDAQSCRNILIRNNDIYECSYGGISLYRVDGAGMEGNSFRTLGDEYGEGFVYSIDSGSRNILFEQDPVQPGSELRTSQYPLYQK